jgi:HD-GYP domain-containing protein (c-di-GMP phosphodiesterase class II)
MVCSVTGQEMLKVISINELQPGMYVEQVVEQTRGLKIKSKGMVKSKTAISQLAKQGILTLEIDLAKSQLSEPQAEPPVQSSPKIVKKKDLDNDSLNNANALYSRAKNVQNQFLKRIRTGQGSDLQSLHDMTLDIIESVTDNPSALACVSLIKNADEYVLEHSLNCSILMSIFANHLQFDQKTVEELGFAGLLMDIGMTTIAKDILGKSGSLDNQEWAVIRNHVDIGVELIEKFGDVSDLVLDVIMNHHERMDGSGYPNGKSGSQIGFHARMAAIIDCYDSLTSARPHRESLSPTLALKTLLSDPLLDTELVQKFIRCIGVHPIGSLVKLKSGKLAMVTRANAKEPLKPQVMSFYNVNSGHFNEVKSLDLSKIKDEIISSMRPDEFKFNLPKFFKEVFIGSLK